MLLLSFYCIYVFSCKIFTPVFFHNQINQLEKDKDVIAQAQAIATLEMLPQPSFSVVNALNNFLRDPKVINLFKIQ